MTRLSHLILLFSAVAMTAALPHPGCVADCAESYISRYALITMIWYATDGNSPLSARITRDNLGHRMYLVKNAARQAGPVADQGTTLSLIPLGQAIGNIAIAIFGSPTNKTGGLVGNVANKAGALIGAVAGQAGLRGRSWQCRRPSGGRDLM
ncbi:hypothetical protein BD779DRAFT_1480755 [Infundibulicybe gibba]|nr:hypothetical protein BD779DRAFT_1480755 [Infundibulicybe gibba]